MFTYSHGVAPPHPHPRPLSRIWVDTAGETYTCIMYVWLDQIYRCLIVHLTTAYGLTLCTQTLVKSGPSSTVALCRVWPHQCKLVNWHKVQAKKGQVHCKLTWQQYTCTCTIKQCYVYYIQARTNIPSLSESTLRRDIASSGESASPEIQVIQCTCNRCVLHCIQRSYRFLRDPQPLN